MPFLLINVVVSAATVLLVLTFFGRRDSLPAAVPTPTFDVASRLESAIPTPSPTVPPSPTPVTYTVQPGDTLGAISAKLEIPIENLMAANGLSNPDALSAGQVLTLPSSDDPLPPTAEPPGVVITATPEGLPQVVIRGAYERENLEQEFIYLENIGGVAVMAGWSLYDGEGNTFTFSGFTLYRGGGVNVYTRAGSNSVINLYWGMDEPLWTPGKVITLLDDKGQVHSTFRVPEG
ncbi:MAG: hypothetical protein BMS9Abin28_0392 [Anaerolineae bacterium]|nr:MAG: hypothetical protein BMS9Abin28_0392 [Anaerolineae bacterium]